MDLKATLKTDISKKGSEYEYVELYITDSIKKRVFLDPAELELLKINTNKNDEMPSIDESFFK